MNDDPKPDMSLGFNRLVEKARRLETLVQAVRRYIKDPGCNGPSKVTAMAKLTWAVDEAEKPLQ